MSTIDLQPQTVNERAFKLEFGIRGSVENCYRFGGRTKKSI
jgi:hypothetical protein